MQQCLRQFGYVVQQWTAAAHFEQDIMMVVGWRIATKHLPSSSMLTNIITVSHDHSVADPGISGRLKDIFGLATPTYKALGLLVVML